MQRIVFFILLLTIGMSSVPGVAMANTQQDEHSGMQVGDIIMEHILDNHQWHLFSIGHFHAAIPLPVIVYSGQTGWHCFLSSRLLKEANMSYQGFSIPTEGEYKGKIIETASDGTISQPVDLSITKNVFAIFVSMGLMIGLFVTAARKYVKNPKGAPTGTQNFIEIFVLFVQNNIARPSLGEEKAPKYLPWLLTIFFFILINNFLGIIPGGANVTGNITVTLCLAIITFFVTLFSGNKHYWLDIFNTPGVPWYLKIPVPLLPFVEFLGVFIKPFVLTLRLFANMTAGHVIVLGFMMMICIFGENNPWAGIGVSPLSVIFSIFMNVLELLVSFIQAYVFTLLSALYVGFAIAEPKHEKSV